MGIHDSDVLDDESGEARTLNSADNSPSQPRRNQLIKKQVKVLLTFSGHRAALKEEQCDFIRELIKNVAKFANVPPEDARIPKVCEDSIVSDIIVHLSSDTSQTYVYQVVKEKSHHLFCNEFIQGFEAPTVEVTHPIDLEIETQESDEEDRWTHLWADGCQIVVDVHHKST